MNTDLLKAGFILVASAGFLLINYGSKKNFKRLMRVFIRPRKKEDDVVIGI